MPKLPSDILIDTYHSAQQLPREFWDALKASPKNANVIFPQAMKAILEERLGYTPCHSLWLICKNSRSQIEFILSVTEGYMGSYPIFIFTTLPFGKLTNDYIRPCIHGLAVQLEREIPHERVYSVFAPEPISVIFADEWTRLTKIANYIQNPFYAAKMSYCTADTLSRKKSTVEGPLSYRLRPAVPADIPGIQTLCYLFAEDSWPFRLSLDRAKEEATLLVQNRLVWVHEAQRPGRRPEIASMVAFTRNGDTVATITKVVTNKEWRQRGCAERLVRRVCEHFLMSERKESVVLYVGHDNPAANVYHRVGFVGLGHDGPKFEDVDPWLEVGFEFSDVKLGHW